jgi:dihydroorotate dehydrogenase
VAAGQAAEAYVRCTDSLAAYADYFTINVSSPNTRGLRALQGQRMLDELLGSVFQAIRPSAASKPVLVKIGPDLSEAELRQVLDVVPRHPVAGIVATNTTLERPPTLIDAARAEAGGLSGAPLRGRADQTIRTIFEHTGGRLPIVGVGGVFTAADALDKLRAGATLVQLYTGMIYQGPLIARRINQGILAHLAAHGLPSVRQLVGQD